MREVNWLKNSIQHVALKAGNGDLLGYMAFKIFYVEVAHREMVTILNMGHEVACAYCIGLVLRSPSQVIWIKWMSLNLKLLTKALSEWVYFILRKILYLVLG